MRASLERAARALAAMKHAVPVVDSCRIPPPLRPVGNYAVPYRGFFSFQRLCDQSQSGGLWWISSSVRRA